MANTYRGKSIGMQNVTFFPVLTDEPGGETTYDEPVRVGRAMRATLTPQLAEALLESDDGVEDELAITTGFGVTFDVSQVSDDVRAAIFGHRIDDAGGLVVTRNEQPQKGALAFKTLLSTEGGSGEKYRYIVLFMGRLKDFPENFETMRRGTITFQTHNGIEGTFNARESDGLIYYSMREDNEKFDETKATAWFTAVQEPTFTPPTGD